MCLYMPANPFIYSAFSTAWLITPTSPRRGKRKTCCSACSEVDECVSVHVRWAVLDSHMTEHQRAVWERVCKQRGDVQRDVANTCVSLQTDSQRIQTQCFSNIFTKKFHSYLEWRCNDLACGSPENRTKEREGIQSLLWHWAGSQCCVISQSPVCRLLLSKMAAPIFWGLVALLLYSGRKCQHITIHLSGWASGFHHKLKMLDFTYITAQT